MADGDHTRVGDALTGLLTASLKDLANTRTWACAGRVVPASSQTILGHASSNSDALASNVQLRLINENCTISLCRETGCLW